MSSRPDDPESPFSLSPSAAATRDFDPNATRDFVQTSGADASSPLLPSLPGYEILHELGRGGMGVVYQARQLGFNRIVALKMILSGSHAGAEERARFRIEAEAVARLQHPNIVQVYEVGEHEGKPFFSMEFCPGGGLDKKLNATPLPPAEAARLMETLARAVEAAHQKGVVHRDLKPANVLLAEDGTLKMTDFGLAKRMDEQGRTATGAVMGTPSYMAPEQAGGKTQELGPACDVYALGAILYECLTGRPPFKGPTTLDTLAQVLSKEPVPPRELQPRTPRDLETICLKCLEKQPGRRYATAAALADDLARWQRGEPVRARPPSLGYVLGKQVRRYRTPLVVAAGMLLLLAAVTAAAFVQVMGARDDAVRKGNDLEQKKGELERKQEELKGALGEKQNALNAKQQTLDNLSKQLTLLARSYADKSDAEYRAGNVHDSVNWMLRAYEAAPRDDPLRPSYLRLIGGRGRGLTGRAFWNDGVWRVDAASLSPDGRTVVTGCFDGTARLWDAASGKEIHKLQHGSWVHSASFSPDGRTVATASDDRTARLWDVASGKEIHKLWHDHFVYSASFSPDGRTVVTISQDKTARLWDAASGKELQRLPYDMVGAGAAVTASVSPDGRTVLAGCGSSKIVRLWDAASGKELHQLDHNPENIGIYGIWAASFSPDGRTVLTGGIDGTARLWDVAGGKELQRFTTGGRREMAVSFSPDGRTVLTGGPEGTARLWDAASGKELQGISTGGPPVIAAWFSPDGRTILTADGDRTARLWDAQSGKELLRLPHKDALSAASFSPDGRTVVTIAAGAVRLWDAGGGTELQRLTHTDRVCSASLSPDGRTVVTASQDKTARLWDAQSGQEMLRLTHDNGVQSASFSPDGRTVVTASWDATAGLWDAAGGKELAWLQHDGEVLGASFSPDGRTVVTASGDNTARVWDACARELLRLTHEDKVFAASFSPDGRTVATASFDKTARLWDAVSGKEIHKLQHDAWVRVASFSRDGRTVLTAGDDKTARLWDAASGKELRRITYDKELNAAALSPDGRTIVTGSWDGTARLCDVASGQELLRLMHNGPVQSASFGPDGRTLLTAGDDGAAHLWALDFLSIPDDVDPDRLRAWVQMRTGKDFTAEGTLHPLSKEEWEQQRRTLEAKGGDWLPPPDPRQWHLAQAAEAEAREAWFAAAFHLSRLIDAEPADASLYARRCKAYALQGRWSQAAADLLQGAALCPSTDEPPPP